MKADRTGKGGVQEAGHSKAGVVFLSLGPTLQEPGRAWVRKVGTWW